MTNINIIVIMHLCIVQSQLFAVSIVRHEYQFMTFQNDISISELCPNLSRNKRSSIIRSVWAIIVKCFAATAYQ